MAHAQGADARQQPDRASLCALDLERIQLVPVENNLMTVGFLNGEGQRQSFQSVGDADELIDEKFGRTHAPGSLSFIC